MWQEKVTETSSARRALEPQATGCSHLKVTPGILRFLRKDLRVALWSAAMNSPLWYHSD